MLRTLLAPLWLAACAPDVQTLPSDTDPRAPTDPVAGDPRQETPAIQGFRVSGRVPARGGARGGDGFVTHVMAVHPASAAPERRLAAVGADGGFSLDLDPGRPWVLVFIDGTASGVDMVLGVLRAEGLDTLAPMAASDADLGEVSVDPAEGTATATLTYDALIDRLGLDAATAAWLGDVDDLSLRYANPDIDDDGIIDIEQDHPYQLDFHLRAITRLADGTPASAADITDRFLDGTTTRIDWNLASIYAIWPSRLDPNTYVRWGDAGGELTGGAAFTAALDDGTAPSAPTSFSALSYGEQAGFGPDYALGATELPGSGGAAATLTWTRGTGAPLTFSRVRTRTTASLAALGVLVPFVRFDTQATSGRMAGVSWEWRKSTATGWIPATEAEITLAAGERGAFVSLHRQAHGREIGISLGRAPTGTVPWAEASVFLRDVSPEAFADTTPADLCDVAVSYDDQLGLRLFGGGVSAPGGCPPG